LHSDSKTFACGASIYILNRLQLKKREDLCFLSSASENLFIEINANKKKLKSFWCCMPTSLL